MTKYFFAFVYIALLATTSCNQKSCDCHGLTGSKILANINRDNISNCLLVEDFVLNKDSTVTVFRYYKDSEGNTRKAELSSVASYRKINGDCAFEVSNLNTEAYNLRSVEIDCDGNIDHTNSLFYDLQFRTKIVLDITNQTCEDLMINGVTFLYEN